MASRGRTSINSNQEVAYKNLYDDSEFDMRCHETSSNYLEDRNSQTLNWKVKWCRSRIEYGNKCTDKCPIARKLKRKEKIKLWKNK